MTSNVTHSITTFLPLEMVQRVILQLDLPELANFSLASHLVNDLCTQSTIIWKSVAARFGFPIQEQVDLRSQVYQFFCHLKEVAQAIGQRQRKELPPEIKAILETKSSHIHIDDIQTLQKYVLKEKIQQISNLPLEIQIILETLETPNSRLHPKDVQTLQKFFIARDTLVLWEAFAKAIQEATIPALNDLPVSDLLKTQDLGLLQKRANLFSNWCKEHQAQLANIQGLFLYHKQLSHLPGEIGYLTGLKQLSLEGNQLSTLPKEFSNLIHLEKLWLHNNELTPIPGEIFQLTQLKYLGLTGNMLTNIPKEISKLTQLELLNLGYNQITELPKEIGVLTQLKHLILTGNRLTTLPKEVKNLSLLDSCYLTDNRLTSLPEEMGDLPQLIELGLNNNQIIALPKAIIKMPRLTIIDLNKNPLNFIACLTCRVFRNTRSGEDLEKPFGRAARIVEIVERVTNYSFFKLINLSFGKQLKQVILRTLLSPNPSKRLANAILELWHRIFAAVAKELIRRANPFPRVIDFTAD